MPLHLESPQNLEEGSNLEMPKIEQTDATIVSIKEETLEKPNQEEAGILAELEFSDKAKRSGRLAVLFVCIAFLIVGRFSVPDNEVKCVEDKVIDAMQGVNTFLNANHLFRDCAQILCSLLVDITFIITFGNWVIRGNSARLPLSMAVFYVTRALVQQIWYSPFPEGYYWESPGIPSLVVPYGRGSDFFFSGHSGFMVICALEWHKLGVPKIRNFVMISGIYTILVLLAYRIHYSIDIFVGVFFAEWCFGKMEANKEYIDAVWAGFMMKVKKLVLKKEMQALLLGQDLVKLNKVEENPLEKV